MKICIIAPIDENIPPKLYGGIGRVITNLVEGLVKKGHDVTLLAPGNTKTSAKLIPIIHAPLEANNPQNNNESEIREVFFNKSIETVKGVLGHEKFDIVNNHLGWRLVPFSDIVSPPIITTLHTPLNQKNKQATFNNFKSAPVISISNNQRNALPDINYIGTIYNGIDLSLFDYSTDSDDYLVFLGRMSPEKGPLEAIQIAKKLGIKLIMAGAIHSWDKNYFVTEIQPHVDSKDIIFMGEIGDMQKNKLLGRAKALLAPIQWEEPFGLVFVESMACGAPVITLNRGSVQEIIIDGITGIIAGSIADIHQRFREVDKISRKKCRMHVEERFSSDTMVNNYEKTFYSYLKKYEKIK